MFLIFGFSKNYEWNCMVNVFGFLRFLWRIYKFYIIALCKHQFPKLKFYLETTQIFAGHTRMAANHTLREPTWKRKNMFFFLSDLRFHLKTFPGLPSVWHEKWDIDFMKTVQSRLQRSFYTSKKYYRLLNLPTNL